MSRQVGTGGGRWGGRSGGQIIRQVGPGVEAGVGQVRTGGETGEGR